MGGPMDDDLLLAYALNQLDPADRAAVAARLADRPNDAARLERLRLALRPLEADRDSIDPPRGLAVAAIARTAEYVVAHGLMPRRTTSVEVPCCATAAPAAGATPAAAATPVAVTAAALPRRPVTESLNLPSWRHADALIAAGIAFLAFGIIVAGIGRLRHESQVVDCQNGLRGLHVALAGYSDTHDGRYPTVGTRQVPVAGEFVNELARAGQLAPGQRVGCPVAVPTAARPIQPVVPAVGYTYTLGFVGPGHQVTGLQRTDAPAGPTDWTAVSADLPAGTAGAPHARGLNVLYLGGMVRFATNPAAGVNGDDIYHNDAGLVRAGLHIFDASLGRPNDVP